MWWWFQIINQWPHQGSITYLLLCCVWESALLLALLGLPWLGAVEGLPDLDTGAVGSARGAAGLLRAALLILSSNIPRSLSFSYRQTTASIKIIVKFRLIGKYMRARPFKWLVLHENMPISVGKCFIVLRMEASNNHFPNNLCIEQYIGLIFVLCGWILYIASAELPPFIAIITYSWQKCLRSYEDQ